VSKLYSSTCEVNLKREKTKVNHGLLGKIHAVSPVVPIILQSITSINRQVQGYRERSSTTNWKLGEPQLLLTLIQK